MFDHSTYKYRNMRSFFLIAFLTTCFGDALHAQQSDTSWKNIYRETPETKADLIHTKIDAAFDFSKSRLNGKVWITAKQHFYASDSLILDAKGMDIHEVSMDVAGKSNLLKYTNDGLFLRIHLGKAYRNNEKFTVFILYTAKPDEFASTGSAAITDAKGLYFINPRGEEKNKPTQIWTQGETEATSVWVPTIDRPNQKTTQETYMTVPAKYVTLSNGKLMSKKNNSDGSRTDYWKMDLAHAPYLFFMGVGDFAIVKDKYKDKEVNYYVEKEYASVAHKIFGNTPEMMQFFSRFTGVEYPWIKYDQIVGRDYVSGAMENTTATLHQVSAQQDARELTDTNIWEGTIAHELFHQWFGDLVTAESWSNLTLNESFARYSEYLWKNYKYGKDAGDAHNAAKMRTYLNSSGVTKDLVRFQYKDKEDMFDAVSYDKGGCILRLLQSYIGDSAMSASLKLYLTNNKFKSAEAHQLRLAFEEVTGKDLTWFWNQWYYGSGHPVLNINYSYEEGNHMARVIIAQTQADKLFVAPVKIDVWTNDKASSYSVVIKNRIDTFYFKSDPKPQLINFDTDKTLLCKKTENKTFTEYLFQYKNARNYNDRREALDAALNDQYDPTAIAIVSLGLTDKYEGLRTYVAGRIDLTKDGMKTTAEPLLVKMAGSDPDRLTKAAAIAKLGDYRKDKYMQLFRSALTDSSYTVSGNALEALGKMDSIAAGKEALKLSSQPVKGRLRNNIIHAIARSGDEVAADKMFGLIESLNYGEAKYQALNSLSDYISNNKSFELLKRGVGCIVGFKKEIPAVYREQLNSYITDMLKKIGGVKTSQGLTEQANYIDQEITKLKS